MIQSAAPLHVAVIGAGAYGLAAALHLLRDGCRVTLIDPAGPGDPRQAAYGNAGILARAGVAPNATPGLPPKLPRMLLDPDGPVSLRWAHLPRALPWLARFFAAARESEVRRISAALATLVGDAVEAHEALAAGTPAARLIRRGHYLLLYPDREAFLADRFGFALRKAQGFDWEERDRERLLQDDPHLGEAYGFAAALDGHGWILDPGGYAAALAEAFARAGGVFRRAEARDVRPTEAGVEIALGEETLAADRAVIACGAWSAALAERLGARVMLESERGYHLTLEGANRTPPFPCMMSDRKIAATPMEIDGRPALRLAGLVEIGGLEAGPSAGPLRLIQRSARRLYPGLGWAKAEPWMGHRRSTPDSLPYLCRAPASERIVLAFGGQHLGLTTGPKAGRVAADLALDRKPNVPLAAFGLDRF